VSSGSGILVDVGTDVTVSGVGFGGVGDTWTDGVDVAIEQAVKINDSQ
jgi:hypothetical protein